MILLYYSLWFVWIDSLLSFDFFFKEKLGLIYQVKIGIKHKNMGISIRHLGIVKLFLGSAKNIYNTYIVYTGYTCLSCRRFRCRPMGTYVL